MTLQDPRDPLHDPRDPLRNDPYRPLDPMEPATDPRDAGGQNWGLIGGLAAVLVLAVVLASFWGGPSPNADQTVRSPAPVTTPQGTDPTTTGSTPGRQPAPVNPVPPGDRPAVPGPSQTTPPATQPDTPPR